MITYPQTLGVPVDCAIATEFRTERSDVLTYQQESYRVTLNASPLPPPHPHEHTHALYRPFRGDVPTTEPAARERPLQVCQWPYHNRFTRSVAAAAAAANTRGPRTYKQQTIPAFASPTAASTAMSPPRRLAPRLARPRNARPGSGRRVATTPPSFVRA